MARPFWGDANTVDFLRPDNGSVAPPWIDEVTQEARALGEAWRADDCSFCDVTLGMAALSRRLIAAERRRRPGPPLGRVLLSPMPDDQHSFGSQLVGALLREAGWDVTADVAADEQALIEAVAAERFEAIGLSIGHERALDRVPVLVRALRRASRGGIVVALGGAMLNGRPDRADQLGADVHVDDARDLSAALLARMMVAACA